MVFVTGVVSTLPGFTRVHAPAAPHLPEPREEDRLKAVVFHEPKDVLEPHAK
jgi:hypothetical protein